MHLHRYMPPPKDVPSKVANHSGMQVLVLMELQAISGIESVLLPLAHMGKK